ncbi:hypothetical protein VNO78_30766 [Psophocarpus tetragonolobus]|uniref:Uncharacterized protein n=1 Tax=Psophocarpus tetragonolobus TaxID=3891 RepID=A0AAN9RYL2_PSOTE
MEEMKKKKNIVWPSESHHASGKIQVMNLRSQNQVSLAFCVSSDEQVCRDLISWNLMLKSYAIHRQAKEALELF